MSPKTISIDLKWERKLFQVSSTQPPEFLKEVDLLTDYENKANLTLTEVALSIPTPESWDFEILELCRHFLPRTANGLLTI